MKYLLLATLLAGCASMNRTEGIYSDILDFNAYTDAYLNYKQIYIGRGADFSIEVIYGNTEFPTVGQCYRTADRNASREVIINPAFWARSNDEDRLELIFHEMGHCDMDFEHQEGIDGIMNSRLSGSRLSDDRIERFFMEGL